MDDAAYPQALLVSVLLAALTFAATLLLYPFLSTRLRWSRLSTSFALLSSCCFFAWFIVHCGRHQFGGYDFNLLMEIGWRQILGQRPYTDFPASTPPGFNLGIKWAWQLLGVSWDANLYLTALFTCVTFLWLTWLLVLLSIPTLAALVIAFAVESSSMLLLSFWWYNNTTLTLAAVFFLSAFLCARSLVTASRLPKLAAQLSFVLSLASLALFKPNLAAVVILPGVLFLLIAAAFPPIPGLLDQEGRPEQSAKHGVEGSRSSLRNAQRTDHSTTEVFPTLSRARPRISVLPLLQTLALPLGAAALDLAILALNHISPVTLVSVYRGVAGERALTLVGFNLMQPLEKLLALFWLPALSIPLFPVLPRIARQLLARDVRAAALSLFLLIGPILALYAVAANGEFRSVECTVLLAASGVAAFSLRLGPPRLRRIAAALLCASIASDLYLGVVRLRVAGVGQHMFFEWSDNEHLIPTGVLRNMRVSATMIELEREIAQARAENPGPLFFGPRVDFNYAVLGIPSPPHLPAWWQPGTAFPRAAVPTLLATWEANRFPTLIFLKDDYTYYPDEFLDLINDHYTRDDRYPALTLYHRSR